MTFKVEITGVEQLTAKFLGYDAKLHLELSTAMQRIVNTIVHFIQSQELGGQILHRRSGTLSRSIMGIVTDDQEQITGNVTSRAGGNAPLIYAAIHEYGGVIHMPARTVTMYRKLKRDGTISGLVRKKSSNFATDHQAKAHDIHIPARPYFKPALEAHKQYIADQLNKAVNRANK